MVTFSDSKVFQITKVEHAFSGDRRTRVLLVGTNASAVTAVSMAQRNPGRIIVGALAETGRTEYARSELAKSCPQIPLLGAMCDLSSVIFNYRINEIHVALPIESFLTSAPELHKSAQEFGIPVTLVVGGSKPEIGRNQSGSEKWTISLNSHAASQPPWRTLKRICDIVLSVFAIVLLLPLLVAVAVAIKCTSRGPVLFRQARVGIGRSVFKMYKFRTMVVNAEQLRREIQSMNDAQGISFKIINDPRLTRIGSVLRRTSIDELPQLLNVLLGDMSMVGPRPIPVWVAEQLQDTRWFRRFSVLPGMSGLWQVEGRQQDFDFMASKDLKYVDEWSMKLDFRILAKTIPAVLKGSNAH